MTAAGHPASRRPAWWALAWLALVLFGNYYVYDSIGPVSNLLGGDLGFSDTQIGALNAVYSAPNIVLTLFGGWLIDRHGAGRVIVVLAGVCLLGALLTAVGSQYPVMIIGRLLFGVGSETMINATTVAVAYWFANRELAFAMAGAVAVARLGSFSADLSTSFASPLYTAGWQPPLMLAAGFAALSFGAALAYGVSERRGRRTGAVAAPAATPMPGLQSLRTFPRAYWYLAVLGMTFYAVIFAFRSTFAIQYFQHAHGLTLADAGAINSVVFLATVLATPLFGWLSDRIGRRAPLLAAGALLLPASFLILGTTDWGLWISTGMVGACYALVPAVLWPATALVVPRERLGLALGAMTVLQNIGTTTANIAAGALNDAAGASAANPAGYEPMLWFFGLLSLAGFACALALCLDRRAPAAATLRRPAAGGFRGP
jgi:MFS family permease